MTVQEFAQKVELQRKASLVKHELDCETNFKNAETHIHQGRKWTRVDIGPSGAYMIDPAGNIYGIKAYGVPNLRHRFGTLDEPKNIHTEWGYNEW